MKTKIETTRTNNPDAALGFSTANGAYSAGKGAKLSGKYRNAQDAYDAHQNYGGNAHAKADFKQKFLTGWAAVGTSTITT